MDVPTSEVFAYHCFGKETQKIEKRIKREEIGDKIKLCKNKDKNRRRKCDIFLISNFRRILNVVCFLLGDSPASEFYIPTFRNTLSVPTS